MGQPIEIPSDELDPWSDCRHGIARTTCSLCKTPHRAAPRPSPAAGAAPTGPRPRISTPMQGCKFCDRTALPGDHRCQEHLDSASRGGKPKGFALCARCREQPVAAQGEQCNRCIARQDVVAVRTAQPPRKEWELTKSLRPWQQRAIQAWRDNRYTGVIEAATGTGKTMVAFAALAELHRRHGEDLRVAVVVPTTVLAHQWRAGLESELHLRQATIGDLHSDPRIEWTPSHPVMVAVINSARTQLEEIFKRWHREGKQIFLIVDECHRSGADSNSKIYNEQAEHTLGLSATPERADGNEETHIYPKLGKPIFRYPLRNALDDGVLAPVVSVNLYIDFTPQEQLEWDDATKALADSLRSLRAQYPTLEAESSQFLVRVGELARQEDPSALRVVGALRGRQRLLAGLGSRRQCVAEVFEWLKDQQSQSLVFHESISGAERSLMELEALGVRSAIDHSQLRPDDRTEALRAFRNGRARALVAVRSLDEGLDVPDADVAIIVAGSRSRRQRIQRIGRVVRHREGKLAVVVSILVRGTPEEYITGAHDADLLGNKRVRNARWPEVPVASAVSGTSDRYEPVRKTSLADRLTLRWLNR